MKKTLMACILSVGVAHAADCSAIYNKEQSSLISTLYQKKYSASATMQDVQHDMLLLGQKMQKFPRSRYHVMHVDNPQNPHLLIVETNSTKEDTSDVRKIASAIFPEKADSVTAQKKLAQCTGEIVQP